MDELPVKVAWRPSWEPGVTIAGVWVKADILEELADRPHNTETTAQEPLTVPRDVKGALEKTGLAVVQTRGGIYAGPAFAEFWKALEFTPRPDWEDADFGALLREVAGQAADNAGQGREEPCKRNAGTLARAHVSSAFALGHLSRTMAPVAEAGTARRLGELLSCVRDLVNHAYRAGLDRREEEK